MVRSDKNVLRISKKIINETKLIYDKLGITKWRNMFNHPRFALCKDVNVSVNISLFDMQPPVGPGM